MTAADLKLFFRTLIKVVAGGPAVGTPGANRAAGLLAALDKLVDFAAEQAALPIDQVDLLALTTDQMDAVLALAFTDCDAAPADSPAWSKPGMHFDAKGADGKNRHYYCSRGTYTPGTAGSGVGPAWHRYKKLD